MKNTNTVVAVLIVAVLVFVGWTERGNSNVGGNACPMDAQVCPDGSSVGRTGPNCEFTACPVSAPVAINQAGEVVLGFGGIGANEKIGIKADSLVQDSRCPSDVQCVAAGELKVNVSFASATGTETKEMVLGGEAHSFGGYDISLVDATGVPKSTEQIAVSDYRLLFKVTEGTTNN